MVSKALITGCSTGIGRATAERLATTGYDVFATARRPEMLDELARLGCRTLALDVTDEESMVAAVSTVVDAAGAVGVLVNHAGIGEYGAVEEAPIDSLRRQVETNVVGPTRLMQLALPQMRAQQWGRIINVASISGKMTFPATAYYSASKYAMEAISDALRFEVQHFGVTVSLIEPGPIKTAFDDAALARLRADTVGGSPYKAFHESAAKAILGAYEGVMGSLAGSPDDVAKVIERAASSKHPRPRYRVGAGAAMMLATRKLLPDRAMDLILRSQFAPPKNDTDESSLR